MGSLCGLLVEFVFLEVTVQFCGLFLNPLTSSNERFSQGRGRKLAQVSELILGQGFCLTPRMTQAAKSSGISLPRRSIHGQLQARRALLKTLVLEGWAHEGVSRSIAQPSALGLGGGLVSGSRRPQLGS